MNHLSTNAGSYVGNSSYKNYKYNGKELQESGMYDYGARMYMPDIGRFGTQDPMQVFDMWQSSYTYANNNPILYQDEYGLGILNALGNLFTRAFNGVMSLVNAGCRCSYETKTTLNQAWRDPDPTTVLFNNLFSGSSSRKSSSSPQSSTPPITPIASNNPAGIIIPDFSSNIPEINPSAMPTPNIGIPDISLSQTLPPLPTNVEFNRDIPFITGTTNLYDQALTEKTLYDLISTLQEHAELRVVISGNTNFDSAGIDENNVMVNGKSGTISQLQIGRANAIKKLLIKRGIDPARILLKKGKKAGAVSTTFKLKEK
jgi:RHS repeat-associated protein